MHHAMPQTLPQSPGQTPPRPDRRSVLRTLGSTALGLAGATVLGACSARKGRVGQPIPENPAFTPLDGAPKRVARAYDDDHALARTRWARFGPDRTRADGMLRPEFITVHHDGMSRFDSISERDAAERLERIRRSHVGRGWADIGYHYAIDPAGRVWQGRPLSLQGAHVRAHNEGNIGIVVLGNFELQRPSSAAVASLGALVGSVMHRHSIALSRVRTHREWAPTACPGRSLQAEVDRLRDRGSFDVA